MKTIDVIAAVLLVVGGLNWGLVGIAGLDLVAWLSGAGSFGAQNALGTSVYVAVGWQLSTRPLRCGKSSAVGECRLRKDDGGC